MKIKSNQRKWLTLPQNGQLNFLTFLFPAAMASLCLVGPLCLPLRHFKPTPDLTVTLRMSMVLSLKPFTLKLTMISHILVMSGMCGSKYFPYTCNGQWSTLLAAPVHHPTRHHLSDKADSQISAKNYFSDIAQKKYFKAPTGSLYNNCSKAVRCHRCNSGKFI